MIRKALLIFAAAAAFALPGSAVTYRGMLDIAPALEWADDFYFSGGYYLIDSYGYDEVSFSLSVSTTHGLQLSKNHFVGIGAEISQTLSSSFMSEKIAVPVYAMWRMDFFGRKWTPFFDLRAGYQLFKGSGMYAAADVGVRLAFSSRTGMNFSLGARARRLSYSVYENDWYALNVNSPCFGLVFRIGVDF